MSTDNTSSASADERYLHIDLTDLFNAKTVGPGGDMRYDGYSFDPESFPKGMVRIADTPFRVIGGRPGNDSLTPAGHRIPIEMPGVYRAASIYLLATSAPGESVCEITVVDADGAESRHALWVPPWWEDADEADRLSFDHRLRQGQINDEKCHIWRRSIHAVASAKPVALILPADAPRMSVFAITVEKVPDHERRPVYCEMLLQSYFEQYPDLRRHMVNWRHAAVGADLDRAARGEALVAMYAAARDADEPKLRRLIADQEQVLEEPGRRMREYTISYLGNAHIDLAWLWQKEETVQVCRDTWAQAVAFMEEFGGFTFAQSQAAGYLWMKQRYPDLYAKMQQYTKKGQWEVVGGTWAESDCNMPCGEAHVRQYLYGKRFFAREFGVDVKVGWYPDTFGYNWNLPQIMRKAGIEYFLTTKLGWNDTTEFPHHLFRWRAPDGSEVLAHQTIGGYGQRVDPKRDWEHTQLIEERTGTKDLLRLYGVGDHGGGPSREDIQRAVEGSSATAFARVRFATAREWFEDVARSGVELPVVEDELYLEFHRGCQTTQARTKKNNRRGEVALMDTEKLAAFAWLVGAEYPMQRIEEAWRILLFNQFHDVLPGSSIAPVYEDAEKDYAEMFAISDEMRGAAVRHLGWEMRPPSAGDTFVVVNTLSWERADVAEIKAAGDVHVVDATGQAVPCQRVDDETLIFVARGVPSMGWKAYRLAAGAPDRVSDLTATDTLLENDAFRVEIDPETGALASVCDKRLGWDVICPGEHGNVMQLYDDNPTSCDAWNIGLGDMREMDDVRELRVVEQGPVRATVRVVRTNGTSTVTQDISVYDGVDRIDFVTHINWQEKHKMLKAAFPMNLDADLGWYEIPFAAIARKNKPETAAEKAKWEVAALRWANLSAGGKSVSILNNCKYGYDCKENVLRLSILRAPTDPDPHADEGEHAFTYSLFTSAGDWRNGTVEAGRELNTPLLVFAAPDNTEVARWQFAVDGGSVILESIKKAEDSDSLILRLFEHAGSDCTARVRLPKTPKRAAETDLLERDIGDLRIGGDAVVVPMGHNSITTVKIEFQD
jgi:alpha-mannosidase